MKKNLVFYVLLFFAICMQHLTVDAAQSQSEASCNTAVDRCAPLPKPKGCPASKPNWSLAGSGIAHCVKNTPTCKSGYELEVDYYGNPSCVKIPTCANGAPDYPTCTPPVTTCANGASNFPTCTFPAPVCANGASNYPICTFPTNTCSNGASDWPVCTAPTNPVVTCPADSVVPASCSPGKTGQAFLITKYSAAPSCIPSSFIDESKCYVFNPPPPAKPVAKRPIYISCPSNNDSVQYVSNTYPSNTIPDYPFTTADINNYAQQIAPAQLYVIPFDQSGFLFLSEPNENLGFGYSGPGYYLHCTVNNK